MGVTEGLLENKTLKPQTIPDEKSADIQHQTIPHDRSTNIQP